MVQTVKIERESLCVKDELENEKIKCVWETNWKNTFKKLKKILLVDFFSPLFEN